MFEQTPKKLLLSVTLYSLDVISGAVFFKTFIIFEYRLFISNFTTCMHNGFPNSQDVFFLSAYISDSASKTFIDFPVSLAITISKNVCTVFDNSSLLTSSLISCSKSVTVM